MISAGSAAVLGCGVKRRVGHQLRGRDCENIEGEAGLERRCYCRYQPNTDYSYFNQLEKLECAKAAYLWLRLATFGNLSLAFFNLLAAKAAQ